MALRVADPAAERLFVLIRINKDTSIDCWKSLMVDIHT
jgi:hypothetical protein